MENIIDPCEHLRTILLGDPDDVADDVHRQSVREIGDPVALSSLEEFVNVAEPLDP